MSCICLHSIWQLAKSIYLANIQKVVVHTFISQCNRGCKELKLLPANRYWKSPFWACKPIKIILGCRGGVESSKSNVQEEGTVFAGLCFCVEWMAFLLLIVSDSENKLDRSPGGQSLKAADGKRPFVISQFGSIFRRQCPPTQEVHCVDIRPLQRRRQVYADKDVAWLCDQDPNPISSIMGSLINVFHQSATIPDEWKLGICQTSMFGNVQTFTFGGFAFASVGALFQQSSRKEAASGRDEGAECSRAPSPTDSSHGWVQAALDLLGIRVAGGPSQEWDRVSRAAPKMRDRMENKGMNHRVNAFGKKLFWNVTIEGRMLVPLHKKRQNTKTGWRLFLLRLKIKVTLSFN